ncbi:hypothetical protein CPB84DRAFT_1746486 [Gymnopilus junonius]|uniref:Uncharacterized protein n=1 Tax=Gymnopilus junonius TaxID=109634 RepID=A0A9P5NRC0_GYMJU|nr:hypothetical protein CPB84DRAFT_1746486 [Gymnopilus junonius]
MPLEQLEGLLLLGIHFTKDKFLKLLRRYSLCLNRASEVKVIPDYFKLGSIVTNRGVNVDRISEEPFSFNAYAANFLCGPQHVKFPLHPSILILQILLKQHPTANIVLVEDSVWHELVKDGYATLPEFLDLVITVLMSCDLVKIEELVSLRAQKLETPPSKAGLIKDLFAKYIDWRAQNQVLC